MLLASLPARNGIPKMNRSGSQNGARFDAQNGNQKQYRFGALTLRNTLDRLGHFRAEVFHFTIANL